MNYRAAAIGASSCPPFNWRPHQTELLWDSLLRGFPIGSLLLAQYDQSRGRRNADNQDDSDREPNFHLIDGQQRWNSITLGFLDIWQRNNRKFQAALGLISTGGEASLMDDASSFVSSPDLIHGDIIGTIHPSVCQRPNGERPSSRSRRQKKLQSFGRTTFVLGHYLFHLLCRGMQTRLCRCLSSSTRFALRRRTTAFGRTLKEHSPVYPIGRPLRGCLRKLRAGDTTLESCSGTVCPSWTKSFGA